MAEYTIELRHIIEHGVSVFDFPYAFYDESKRKEFEEKFIKHFYFREIGCESVERFKWYLEDKMNTVFPYYNELFKSASIEYDVLDNYKLTETYTRKVENENKQSGISSTVGQAFGNQETETNQKRTVNTVGTFDGTENGTETETGKSTTDATGKTTTEKTGNSTTETSGTSNTTSTETTEGSNSKTTNSSGSTEQDAVEKFLDTPQGLTNLTNSKYLTTLKQTTTDGSQTSEGSESGSDNRITKGSNNTTTTGSSETYTTESAETNTTDSSETNTQATKTKSNTVENDTTGQETTADNVTGTMHTDEKTTTDNNTRMYVNGEQNETYTLTRRGNIGVDTDSDAIEKHNRLQKTLKKIELMFFDECEDLFMLVY